MTSATDRSLQQAVAHHQRGDIDNARHLYRQVLAADPDNFHALHFLGLIEAQAGRHEEAVRLIGRALGINDDASARLNFGNALRGTGQLDEAIRSYDHALRLAPNHPRAWNNRGVCALELHRATEALENFDRALALEPHNPETLNNRGNALFALRRYAEAIGSYDAALQRDPGYAEAWSNRGNALFESGQPDAALESFHRALRVAPDHLDALNNLGTTLLDLGRSREALPFLRQLVALCPDFDYAPGALLSAQLKCCDWDGLAPLREQVIRGVRQGRRSDIPFNFLAVSETPADQLTCARTTARHKLPPQEPLWQGERYRHRKIRLAYLSADLHNHATSWLMARLFEIHDRSRFEVTAISYGPDPDDEMRRRMRGAFDRFLDVRDQDDREVAAGLRDLEIDIAVDLKGYTAFGRPAILSYRPAPVQVNYMGYPGTVGVDWIDYIIGDATVIPGSEREHYAEKVVWLPDTYWVTDSSRPVPEPGLRREEQGLPPDGFVFCSFNNHYKINPAAFDVWMRLLHSVDGSVLWLLGGNAAAEQNLRREAQARGVAPQRLVFAPPVAQAAHLARHRLADLVLDTLPYNAHTTASDALWAGVPVLTLTGHTFVGRVAASLLQAAGLPRLITRSAAEYEALALRLATEPSLLADVRTALDRNRTTCPLFDTDRFRRHMEAAYITMWERHERGEAPAHFAVDALA